MGHYPKRSLRSGELRSYFTCASIVGHIAPFRLTQTLMQVPDGMFVHPVLDQRVMAGNGTVALEVVEDLPDVDAILVPYGGGALVTSVGLLLSLIPKPVSSHQLCAVE